MVTTWNSLREWDRVLGWLEYSIRQHSLDSRERDLIWLLRFNDNWRLREAALKAVRHLKEPSAGLMSEVVRIIEDTSLYSGVRVLGAEALAHLLDCNRKMRRPPAQKKAITRRLRALMAEPQPPIVTDAVRSALDIIEAIPASGSVVVTV